MFSHFKRTALARLAHWGGLLWDARWVVISLVLLILGFASAFLPAHATLWSATGLGLVSLFVLVADLRDHLKSRRRTDISGRENDDFEDVRRGIRGSARFRILDFPSGDMLIDDVASNHLRDNVVLTSMRPVNYVLPSEIREAGTLWRQRVVAKDMDAYNGQVLGLDSNFGSADEWDLAEVATVGARYWDHLASDSLAMQDYSVEGHERPEFGRSLFIDRRHHVRDFADSWLLNSIGTSLLAITSDFRFVVVLQTDANHASPNLYAPSGSGSLEPQDFGGASQVDFKDLLRAGAEREMREEAGLLSRDIEETHFLGFGRWLQRAAKPDVFTLAFLNIDSHEVKRRSPGASDRAFTRRAEPQEFVLPLTRWTAKARDSLVDESVRRRLSLPLAVGLTLLAEQAVAGGEIAEALRKRYS